MQLHYGLPLRTWPGLELLSAVKQGLPLPVQGAQALAQLPVPEQALLESQLVQELERQGQGSACPVWAWFPLGKGMPRAAPEAGWVPDRFLLPP